MRGEFWRCLFSTLISVLFECCHSLQLGQVESEHSLFAPFDLSFADWRYGGGTVATSKLIRLTPNTQSKRGWLFNEYSMDANDWQIEFDFSVHSTYHMGGDGFALWLLDRNMHPTKKGRSRAGISTQTKTDFNKEDLTWLTGDLFGIRSEWPKNAEGFGVVFDTYDNDQKRDNPLVFSVVVRNETESQRMLAHDLDVSTQSDLYKKHKNRNRFEWDHQTDFYDSMYRRKARIGDGSGDADPHAANECSYDYRNALTQRVLIRYLFGTLHVYFKKGMGTGSLKKKGRNGKKRRNRAKKNKEYRNSDDSGNDEDWVYCMSVDIGMNTKGKYLALSAMTGAVADNHDIEMLNTRFFEIDPSLDSPEAMKKMAEQGGIGGGGEFPGLDDSHLQRAGLGASSVGNQFGWLLHVLFWLIEMILNGAALVCVVLLFTSWQGYQTRRNGVEYMREANGTIKAEYGCQIIGTVLLLLFHFSHMSHLVILLVNAPTLLLKLYAMMTSQWLISINQLRNAKPMGRTISSQSSSFSLFAYLDTNHRGSLLAFLIKGITHMVTFVLCVQQFFW